MRNLNKNFENKTIDYEKVLEYGFSKKENSYFYENKIYDNHFKVVVELSSEKQIAKVIDLSSNEEYVLVDVKDYVGNFSKKVREEYEIILNDIIEKCTTPNVFKSKQAKQIIKYIKEKYHDDLEYLWKKSPNVAICRNKTNNKWYGILFVLSESKLKIKSNKTIDVINLKYPKDSIKNIIDNEKIFAGYHMNKNNWITIKLDESIDIKEIYKLLDNSYKLSKNK